jgi:hypothetical protein
MRGLQGFCGEAIFSMEIKLYKAASMLSSTTGKDGEYLVFSIGYVLLGLFATSVVCNRLTLRGIFHIMQKSLGRKKVVEYMFGERMKWKINTISPSYNAIW